MTSEELANEMQSYVIEKSGATFVELERIASKHGETKGSLMILSPNFKNIILWAGVNQWFVDAITSLFARKSVKTTGTSNVVYIVDGKFLTLPLVRELKDYDTPHWLPLEFNRA